MLARVLVLVLVLVLVPAQVVAMRPADHAVALLVRTVAAALARCRHEWHRGDPSSVLWTTCAPVRSSHSRVASCGLCA